MLLALMKPSAKFSFGSILNLLDTFLWELQESVVLFRWLCVCFEHFYGVLVINIEYYYGVLVMKFESFYGVLVINIWVFCNGNLDMMIWIMLRKKKNLLGSKVWIIATYFLSWFYDYSTSTFCLIIFHHGTLVKPPRQKVV